MNSASPSTLGWCLKGSRSSASSRAPEVSRWVAGTQDESCTRRSITVTAAHSRKNSSPATPSTLQISWGSQIAVVVPRGTTQRSNSSGGTSVDSQWTWLSMKPGTATSPRPSISLAPA